MATQLSHSAAIVRALTRSWTRRGSSSQSLNVLIGVLDPAGSRLGCRTCDYADDANSLGAYQIGASSAAQLLEPPPPAGVPAHNRDTYLMDSGAAYSVAYDKSILADVEDLDVPIELFLADNNTVKAKEHGKLRLSDRVTIDHVLYVPGIKRNLVSLSCIAASGYRIVLGIRSAQVFPEEAYARGERVAPVLSVPRVGRVYVGVRYNAESRDPQPSMSVRPPRPAAASSAASQAAPSLVASPAPAPKPASPPAAPRANGKRNGKHNGRRNGQYTGKPKPAAAAPPASASQRERVTAANRPRRAAAAKAGANALTAQRGAARASAAPASLVNSCATTSTAPLPAWTRTRSTQPECLLAGLRS